MPPNAIDTSLPHPDFPRSNRYDAQWVLEGNLGPNPLWLTEWLTGTLDLQPGMRVLDLGCGRALSSVFLAREFDVRVHAADLWAPVDDNWKRVEAAGEAGRVTPVQVEAHALPFPSGYFDAVVSIDAYQYFGTDVLYLHYLSRFLRPGGMLGIVVPGLVQPFPGGEVPDYLREPQANGKVFWEDECVCFRTAPWWEELLKACVRVHDVRVDVLPDGWRLWLDFERAVEQAGASPFPSDAEAIERDGGRHLGFVRATARRGDEPGFNLYEPGLLSRIDGDG